MTSESCSDAGCPGSCIDRATIDDNSQTIWIGPEIALDGRSSMDREQVLRLLLPLWGVAFVAGFVMACR